MKHALIVEDEPFFRQYLRHLLSSKLKTPNIREAGNGKEALKEFKARIPDIVLMDISLPDSNGLDLTKKMKQMNTRVAIVIVTNHDTPEYREAALECGAAAFVSKAAALEEEIEAALKPVLVDP